MVSTHKMLQDVITMGTCVHDFLFQRLETKQSELKKKNEDGKQESHELRSETRTVRPIFDLVRNANNI